MSSSASRNPGDIDDRLVEQLFERAGAARWGLSRATFARALERSLSSRFRDERPSATECRRYLEALQLEELALAAACSEGLPAAWAHFIDCYRPALRRAASAIAGDQAGAELADNLYAELYGLEERHGHRRSLFDYFHGRSRLSTWLRAVIAQAHVDRGRAHRRLQPLDAAADPPAPSVVIDPQTSGELQRFAAMAQSALASAIRALEPGDRLRLSLYYLQRLTLARIGGMTGEHEATVSRKLDRTRRELRAAVERLLRELHGLNADQVRECLDAATLDTGMDLARAIAGPSPTSVQEPGG
jgi:RNA polymerase sigma factor (sigma-70 family)